MPRNKERRKQHQGTSINIPVSPESINRENGISHNPHTPPPFRPIQASRERQATRPATRTDYRNESHRGERPAARTERRDEARHLADLSEYRDEKRKQATRRPADSPTGTEKRATSDERQAPPHRPTSRKTTPRRTPRQGDKRNGERTNARHPRDRESRQRQAAGGAHQTNRHSKHKKRRGEVFITSSPSPDRPT